MTFLVFVYNEARRIRHVLDHAEKWASEIVVVDKGSTDGTLDIIQAYGARIRLISIPYSDRGHEDMTLLPRYATEEWIFMSTCSEIPTRKLIRKCEEVLAARGGELDLIYVPRLMYFFGHHREPDNGGTCDYPFLIHRDRTIISNEIHSNFRPRDPARTHRIPYEDDCCVHHFTHPSVASFWLSSLSYFAVETKKDEPPDKAIRSCFKNIEKLSQKILAEGENWLPFYCALASYELGKALSVWEKAQGGPHQGAEKYEQLARMLIAREWGGNPSAMPEPIAAPIRIGGSRTLKRLLVPLAKFPYLLMKISVLFRRLKIKDD